MNLLAFDLVFSHPNLFSFRVFVYGNPIFYTFFTQLCIKKILETPIFSNLPYDFNYTWPENEK